ncbi:SDR family oxidoreductase [Litoribacter alkaliphilus]|uniref:SDR family oxidoreductase n=1 Tax=Litoribacter ruber TaxID=702568 RepID=A0AAP2CIT3_9BACT|nr:SDR family oxidoreductase [Litoribacter alkaliphilus]MBS9524454.1 SDR family oxidoreductase [Litoribacter alkaliphilus]
MTKIKNSTVLITGGAAGIGKLMGRNVLEEGAAHLVIWDINESQMLETAAELGKIGSVHTYQVNVADLNEINQAFDQMLQDGLAIDILINNAGIVVGRYFWENSHEDIEKTMLINTNALMHIALKCLPGMMAKNHGHIVNISSAASLIGNPKMAVYAASKWAVTGWSESLRLELEQVKSKVKVTTITPSYINTGMFEGVKTHWIQPILTPEKTAKQIIKGIKKNSIFVRMPKSVYLTPILKGLLPIRWFDKLVGGYLGVYSSMKDFHGHAAEEKKSTTK